MADETFNGAGADSSQQTQAAASGTTSDGTGAVSPENQQAAAGGADEQQNSEQSNSQESENGATEEKKQHNKSLETRAMEIADKIVSQRIAEAEARRQASQVDQPDFIQVDYNAYDSHIAKLISKERAIQDELSLDPENPVNLVRALRQVQQERLTLENNFQANEQKKAAWQQRHQQQQQQQQFAQTVQEDINRTVGAIGSARGITPEALEAGRAYMNSQFQQDPNLQRRFDDLIQHRATYHGFSGVNAAVEWAISHAQENMGKNAQQAIEQRNAGKDINLSGANEGGASFAGVNNFSDLMKLPSEQINQFAKEHPQKFNNLKEKHFK